MVYRAKLEALRTWIRSTLVETELWAVSQDKVLLIQYFLF